MTPFSVFKLYQIPPVQGNQMGLLMLLNVMPWERTRERQRLSQVLARRAGMQTMTGIAQSRDLPIATSVLEYYTRPINL